MIDDFIVHFVRLVSNLWQIRVFCKGNTRTTVVFLIKYLRKFGYDVTNDILRNLIFNEKKELKNRYLYINWSKKLDIEDEKVDINSLNISTKMKKKIINLYNGLSQKNYFGRIEVMSLLTISPSGASKFLKILLDLKIITSVKNHGKGKYCFNVKNI